MKDNREWFKVSTSFFRHPKTLQLTPAETVGLLKLWAHAVEQKNDGILNIFEIKNHISKRVLEHLLSLNFIEKSSEPDIYILHDFTRHQATAEEMGYGKKRMSNAGSKAMHKRWHVERGIKKDDCEHCQSL